MDPWHTTHPRFDAVICDIDGCLCPEDSNPMDAPGLAAIAEHNRAARERRDRPLLTVCSGRPQPFAEAMCRLVGTAVLPCSAENGVWLYHPATNEYDRDPSVTRDHLRMVQEARQWVGAELGPQGVVMQPGKAASISLYHPDTEFLHSLVEPVRDHFHKQGWPLRVSTTWYYINCDLEHVSKATGAARLMQRAGLDPQRCLAIGDTQSDLAVADEVAFFACPANAADEVKARADMIAERAHVEGVLEILASVTGDVV